MTNTTHLRARRPWRRIAALGFLLLVLILTVWGLRAPIAGMALRSWCAGHGLTCTARITALTPDKIALEGLSVSAPAGRPLAVDAVSVDLTWPSLFRPEATRIALTRPVVRGTLSADGLDLYGLADLVPSGDGSGGGAPIPVIDIEGGIAELQTDAGPLTARFETAGRLFETGSVSIAMDPVQLSKNAYGIDLRAGDLNLTFEAGAANGRLQLDAPSIALRDVSIDALSGTLDLAETDDGLHLDWSGAVGALQHPDLSLASVSLSGLVEVAALRTITLDDILPSLRKAALSGEGRALQIAGLATDQIEFNLEAQPTDQGFSGLVSLRLLDLNAPDASADRIDFEGQLHSGDRTAATDIALNGVLVASGLSIQGPGIEAVIATAVLPEPLTGHASALQRVARRAAERFDLETRLAVDRSDGQLSVQATGPLSMSAASGLRLDVQQANDDPWLAVTAAGLTAGGDFEIKGGGAPRLSGALNITQQGADRLEFAASHMDLAPWRVSGRTVGATLRNIELVTGSSMRIAGRGRATLSGAMPGVDLEQTSIEGDLIAELTETGWQVETRNGSCLTLMSGGAVAGTVRVDPLRLRACPDRDGLLNKQKDIYVGKLNLGDLRVPFDSAAASGTLGFDAADVRWQSGDGFQLYLTGEALTLPLDYGERTLTVQTASPSVTVSVLGGPVAISANLGETQFGGSVLPIDMRAQQFSYEGRALDRGFDGQAMARGIRIAAPGVDPAFQPVVSDFSVNLESGRAEIEGIARGAETARAYADIRATLALDTLSGTARIVILPLTFVPGGFQPYDLSERLRGVLTNASGRIEGAADFRIEEGNVTGTAKILADSLSFETLSVGQVTGVSGEVFFSDIFGVQTPPGQTVTVAEISPGVPLQDGRVVFQLLGPTIARLESAIWPFAGGELSIAPAEWEIGAPQHRVIAIADRIELERLIALLKVPDLEATGSVSGQFPVDIAGADILVRDAQLEVDKAGGTLSYTGAATDRIAGQNEYADLAFEALKDFDFSVMRVGADGNLIGDLLLTVELLGSSEDVLDGAEFAFDISIDSKLSQLIRSFSSTVGETYLGDAANLQPDTGTAYDED